MARLRDDDARPLTLRELFAAMVCGQISKRLRVPFKDLRWVHDFMLQDGADHFCAAVDLIGTLGVPVMLLTDLRETFVMDSVLEFIDMMQAGYLNGDESEIFVFLKVNPIVNKLLGCLREPLRLPNHGQGYQIMQEMQSALSVQTPSELEMLKLIRNKACRRIEARLQGGHVKAIEVEEELGGLNPEALVESVLKASHEDLKFTIHGGDLVSATRRVIFEPPGSRPASEGMQVETPRRRRRKITEA